MCNCYPGNPCSYHREKERRLLEEIREGLPKMRKYTVVIKTGLITEYCYVEAFCATGASFEEALARQGIDLLRVWFVFDGHCQPSNGYERGQAKVDEDRARELLRERDEA